MQNDSIMCARMRAVLVFVVALLHCFVAADMPTIYDYQFDGSTTYCYDMNQGLPVQNLDYTYTAQKASGSACPVLLSIKLTSMGTLRVNQEIEFELKAHTNFDVDNAFHMRSLLSTVNDGNGVPTEIPHANVHVCDRVTICDIFRSGTRPNKTPQQMGNFTDGAADFLQKISWTNAGDKIIYGHMALPPKNPYNESLHFMVFMNLTIAAAVDDSTGSSSTGLMVGIILGAVAVVVGVIVACMCCRRGKDIEEPFPVSPSMPAGKSSRIGWSHNADATFDAYDRSMRSQFQATPMNSSSLMFQDDPAAENAASRMMRFNGNGSHHSVASRQGGGGNGNAMARSGMSRSGMSRSGMSRSGMSRSNHSSQGPDMSSMHSLHSAHSMHSSMRSQHRDAPPPAAYDYYPQFDEEESMGTSTDSMDFGNIIGAGPVSEAYSINHIGIPADGAFPSPLNEDELAALARDDRATTLSSLGEGPRETEESMTPYDDPPNFGYAPDDDHTLSNSEASSQFVDSVQNGNDATNDRSWTSNQVIKPPTGGAFEL